MSEVTASSIVESLRAADEPIVVALRGGVRLKFRRPKDAGEFLKIGTAARKFARMLANSATGPFVEYRHLPQDVAVACYWISELGLDPAWTQLEALRLAAECGSAAMVIYYQLGAEMAPAVTADEQEVMDELGEGSEPTSSAETT